MVIPRTCRQPRNLMPTRPLRLGVCYQASHTQPVQNGLLLPRSRPPPSKPATPATGTTVYLRAQTRKLVLNRDSSLSFSPHSINKYCQLYLQRISQEEKVTSTPTGQASSPPLHDAGISPLAGFPSFSLHLPVRLLLTPRGSGVSRISRSIYSFL